MIGKSAIASSGSCSGAKWRDKGYDSETLWHHCDRVGMQPLIARRKMRRKPRPGLPRLFDQPTYRQCNVIERLFNWLKEKRRFCTRFASGQQLQGDGHFGLH